MNIRKVPGYRIVGPQDSWHLYGPESQACVFCGCALEIAERIERPGENPCVPWKHADESMSAYRDRLLRDGFQISAAQLERRWNDIAAWEIAAWGMQVAVTEKGLVDEAEEVTAAVRGARIHQTIEDEYAYSQGEVTAVRVNGKVVRERIRGGFATRRRIQWARFYVVLVRRALSRDWWQVLRDSASSDFIAHEHQRHCPHRLDWRTFYPGHRWQSCSACAKPFDHTGGDSGKVG